MTNQPETEWIDFGFETVPAAEKQSRVAMCFHLSHHLMIL